METEKETMPASILSFIRMPLRISKVKRPPSTEEAMISFSLNLTIEMESLLSFISWIKGLYPLMSNILMVVSWLPVTMRLQLDKWQVLMVER